MIRLVQLSSLLVPSGDTSALGIPSIFPILPAFSLGYAFDVNTQRFPDFVNTFYMNFYAPSHMRLGGYIAGAFAALLQFNKPSWNQYASWKLLLVLPVLAFVFSRQATPFPNQVLLYNLYSPSHCFSLSYGHPHPL